MPYCGGILREAIRALGLPPLVYHLVRFVVEGVDDGGRIIGVGCREEILRDFPPIRIEKRQREPTVFEKIFSPALRDSGFDPAVLQFFAFPVVLGQVCRYVLREILKRPIGKNLLVALALLVDGKFPTGIIGFWTVFIEHAALHLERARHIGQLPLKRVDEPGFLLNVLDGAGFSIGNRASVVDERFSIKTLGGHDFAVVHVHDGVCSGAFSTGLVVVGSRIGYRLFTRSVGCNLAENAFVTVREGSFAQSVNVRVSIGIVLVELEIAVLFAQ